MTNPINCNANHAVTVTTSTANENNEL